MPQGSGAGGRRLWFGQCAPVGPELPREDSQVLLLQGKSILLRLQLQPHVRTPGVAGTQYNFRPHSGRYSDLIGLG